MTNDTTQTQPKQALNIDRAKAAMGVASRLQGMLLPQKQSQPQPTAQPTAQTTAETANPAPQPPSNQQNPTDVNEQIQALEGRVMDEMSQLKDEIRKVGEPKDQNKEIIDLKNQLEAILNES